jgi:ArsR family transcriptional regulator
LVTDRREGLWIHYRIRPGLPGWVQEVLEATARGQEGGDPFAEDARALAGMPDRPGAPRCA